MWHAGSEENRRVFMGMMRDPRVRKIVMRRECHLAVYVSRACAAATGAFIKANSDHLKARVATQSAYKITTC
jgi:hypothetical protein